MALVVKDRVKVVTTTTGTGTLTLGSAVAKFQDFSVIGDGNTTYYAIESGNGTDWEVGVGTYTASGTTLSRDTILESSNAGSAISLTGTSTVFCTYPAERSVNTADIGTTIQAYDADTAKYDDTTANFTGTLQNGGSNVVVDSDIGSTVQAYDADTTKNDVANTFTANQTINADLTVDTDTLVVDSTNNRVGIGTSSPNSKVSIEYSSSSTTAFATYANIPLLFKNTSNTDNNWSIIACQDASGDFASYIGTQYTSQASSTAVLTFGTNPGSGATERMRITSGGDVGIGTTAPNGSFGVTRSGTGQICDFKNTNAAWAGDVIISYAPSGVTTSLLSFSTRSDGNTWVGSTYGGMHFYTGTGGSSSERMRIDSSGSLRVGGTSSFSLNEKIALYGTSTANNPTIISDKAAAGVVSSNHILFNNGNGYVGSITTLNSATAFNTSSDYRLKENNVDITDGITRVKQLNPYRFNFIANPDTTVDGFFAHEAQAVVPEAVTGTKDEVDDKGNPVYQGIDQSKLVPLLTAALQEAITKIEDLETRIQALENQ